MSRTVTASVSARYIEVDVDLEEIDTDDLLAELRERNKLAPSDRPSSTPSLSSEETHPLHEIYYAFKFGLTDRATELARAYVCDELGVVL